MFLRSFFNMAEPRHPDAADDERAYDPDQEYRDQVGRSLGRFFGLLWLVFLLNLQGFFAGQHLSVVEGIGAWGGLALFALSYAALMLFGRPLWARQTAHDIVINRMLVGLMILVNTAFVVAFSNEDFGTIYIYAAVCAGMYLQRKESMQIIAFLTVAAVGASLYAGSSAENLLTSALLVGGIGMNTVFWCALMAQNRDLRRARAEITRLAVSEERLRFARDLHDLLGHSLSVIALKSELAGRLVEKYPERATSEIADVEHVARTALQEVRDAVTGYRKPSLSEELNNAAQMLRAAGSTVRIQADIQSLPTEIDRVLAWFVREGTTNIIRHAGTTSASISISEAKGDVFAELTDTGRPRGGSSMFAAPTGSGGSGLVGLRERIRACDGELTTGPLPGGGFRLYARIPLTPGAEERMDPVRPPIPSFTTPRLEGTTA